jgi:hypothetical protein
MPAQKGTGNWFGHQLFPMSTILRYTATQTEVEILRWE